MLICFFLIKKLYSQKTKNPFVHIMHILSPFNEFLALQRLDNHNNLENIVKFFFSCNFKINRRSFSAVYVFNPP